LPIEAAAATIGRFCASGLPAVASAAQRAIVRPDEMGIGPILAVPKLLARRANVGGGMGVAGLFEAIRA
jgi:acetyl-CoA acetyltransferase